MYHITNMQVLFSSQIDSSLLFDPSLISQKLQQELPSGFILRPLHIEDFDKGIIYLFEQLITPFYRIFNNSRPTQYR